MKNIIIIICFAISLNAQNKYNGTIVKISTSEILIKHEDVNKPFQIGDKLILFSENNKIILEVIFPMQTISRCKLISGNISNVHVGMKVLPGSANTMAIKIDSDKFFIDSKNDLMWIKDANLLPKYASWYEAIQFCNTLKYAGFSDWRLPSKEEFELLVQNFPKGGILFTEDWRPLLTSKGFTNIKYWYWTSSENNKNSNEAWDVDLTVGKFNLANKSSINAYGGSVLPVRGTKK
mgnify:CR=1 FL=1